MTQPHSNTDRAEYKHAWYQANKERLLGESAVRYAANPSKVKARVTVRQKAKAKDINAYHRAYRVAHREKVNRWARRYKDRKRGVITPGYEERIRAMPCAWCKAAPPSEVDHVVPLSKGGMHEDGNLQPLCRSCNGSKRNRVFGPRLL